MNRHSIQKSILKSPLHEEVSAKNYFSRAGALMCITRERYGLSRIGLHHYVHRRAHFTMVSISWYVKIIASGGFSQTRSHIMTLKLILVSNKLLSHIVRNVILEGYANYVWGSVWWLAVASGQTLLFSELYTYLRIGQYNY